MKKLLLTLSMGIICFIAIASPYYAQAATSSPEYLNGGIGEEDLDSLRKAAKGYPLGIVFSEGDGAYITNVGVGIYNQADSLVFYNKDSGPHLYVKLPNGDYQVVAIYKGEKRSYKITLNTDSSKKIFFNWKEQTPAPEQAPQDKRDDRLDLSIP